jgi:hypothetical protein
MTKEIREQINLVKNLNESLKNLNENKSYGFFKTTSSIPDYEKVLSGKNSELPNKYKHWKGEVQWMSKEDYFRECARIQNTSYSDQFRYVVDNKVQLIMERMEDGIKFDIPYLNYVENEQEGRHRVVAADNLGQKLIPILVLYDVEEDNSIELSDMLGKWDDLVERNGIYYVKFNITDWKSGDNLLSSIVSDYDYYFLDVLFNMYKEHISIKDYLVKMIDNQYVFHSFDNMVSYVMKNNIYYYSESDEQFSKEFMLYCFIFKILKHNEDIFYDCILRENDTYYLKIVPQDMYVDFENYKNGQDMLIDMSKKKYYVNEYNLIPTDDNSNLYTIDDKDINMMKKIFDTVNEKYI